MRPTDFLRTAPVGVRPVPPTAFQSNLLRACLALLLRQAFMVATLLGVVLGTALLPSTRLGDLLQGAGILVGMGWVFLCGRVLQPHLHTLGLLKRLNDADLPEMNRLAETVPGGNAYRDAVWAMGRPFLSLDRAILRAAGEHPPIDRTPPSLAGERVQQPSPVELRSGHAATFHARTRLLRLDDGPTSTPVQPGR